MSMQSGSFLKSREIAARCVNKIKKLSANFDRLRLMHVCGTHEDTITKYGIRELLPANIEVVSGPGCPVCVTTEGEIDEAISALEFAAVTTFGDLMRVPSSSGRSLSDAKADGFDVRVVYSIYDAIGIARSNKDIEVVHIGIGFETTAPSTASVFLGDEKENLPGNFSVLSCHRVIPPAMDALVAPAGEGTNGQEPGTGMRIDGFIDPGHVSTIIGVKAYEEIGNKYKIPQVIAGFEPLDVLFAILMLVEMIGQRDFSVRNEYIRAVSYEGNKKALKAMDDVFERCALEWRGFPQIPGSGLKLRENFSVYDARERFDIKVEKSGKTARGCRCADVLKGLISPDGCPLFGKACTLENPVGACMVSSEGSCGIWYKYGKI